LLALLVLDAFFAYCFCSEHGGWDKFLTTPYWQFAVCVLVVAPLQTYSLARIGIYEGLAQTTSLRASFMTAWNACLLPWISWFAAMLTLETCQRYLILPGRITDTVAFSMWVSVQVFVCGLCTAYAVWRLHRNFRSLAAQARTIPWWKRWPANIRGYLARPLAQPAPGIAGGAPSLGHH
jgi:hypothetical protein